MPTEISQGLVALLLCVPAGYFGWRVVGLVLRASRARRAYPKVVSATPDARVFGCLLGLAVGDALGLPADGLPAWLVKLRYPNGPRLQSGLLRFLRRAGDVSDDTQLTIAVARSIMPDGCYCHERFRDELRQFYAYRVRAGRATTQAARRLWRDRYAPAAPLPSEGSGAAIRVAPLGLAFDSEDKLLASVARNTLETHAGPLAMAAAKLVALLVFEAKRLPPGELPQGTAFDLWLRRLARRAGFSLDLYRRAFVAGNLSAQLGACGAGGHAQVSLTRTLLLLRQHKNDFRASMARAFFAGGPAGSVSSMLGAVLGANLGHAAIPESFQALHCRSYLSWLAHALERREPRTGSGQLRFARADLGVESAGALVNTWSSSFMPHRLSRLQGVSRALQGAGGQSAIAEVSRRPPLPLGGAIETAPGNLNSIWLVHVAGVGFWGRSSPSAVQASIDSALCLAAWLGVRSVALPLIGSGGGGLGLVETRELIRQAVLPWLDHFEEIRVVHPSAFARPGERSSSRGRVPAMPKQLERALPARESLPNRPSHPGSFQLDPSL